MGLWGGCFGGDTHRGASRSGNQKVGRGGSYISPKVGGHLEPCWGCGGLKSKHVARDPPFLIQSKSAVHNRIRPQQKKGVKNLCAELEASKNLYP